MALSEWLRSPNLDLRPELPHIVSTILDSSRLTTEFRGLSGVRSASRELAYRSGRAFFNNDYLIDFIRAELQDPRAITILLDGLTDINEDVRKQAIVLLENLAHVPEVVEGVAAALDDPDPQVRNLAGRTISEHGTEHVIAILENTMASSKIRAKIEAVRCLSRLGPKAIPVIEKAFAEQSGEVQFEAALALADNGITTGSDCLKMAAEISDLLPTRIRALETLGKLQNEQCLSACLHSLNASQSALREAALRVLGSWRAADVVRPVIEHFLTAHAERLVQANRTDTASELRAALDIGIKLKIEIPLDLASALLVHHDWQIRQTCAQAMAFSPEPDAKKLLKNALKDSDNDVREAAIHSLVTLQEVSCHRELVKMASSDPAENVRKAAAKALEELGHSIDYAENIHGTIRERIAKVAAHVARNDTRSVPILVEALSDKNVKVRREVVKALGIIGSPTVYERLLGITRTDHDEEVRVVGGAALIRIGCPRGKDGKFCLDLARVIEEKKLVSPEEVIEALPAIKDDSNICILLEKAVLKSLAVGSGVKQAGDYADFLKANLKHDDWENRLYAITALAGTENQDVRESFLGLLDDPQIEVRREAARALGLVGDARAITKLTQVAEGEPDNSVREEVCLSLAAIGQRL
jgi:HEAT repeat protein